MILVIVSLVRAGVYAAINTTGAEPNVCLLIYLHSAEVIMSGSVPAFRLAGPFTMSFLIIFFLSPRFVSHDIVIELIYWIG